MLAKPIPSLDYLNECFLLEKNAGILIWKVRPLEHFDSWKSHRAWNAAWPGKRAGRLLDNGYRSIFIKAKGGAFREHRIVWAIANQALPTEIDVIDHINGIKTDNRPENLRICMPVNNSRNRTAISSDNKSGYRGVCKQAAGWAAYININRKQCNLGYYKTREQAAQVAQQARDDHYGEFKGITHKSSTNERQL